MCKSIAEGGQRCAAHTRPAYLKAVSKYRPHGRIDDEMTEAVIAFASTPTGARAVAAAIEVADAQGEPGKAAWLNHARTVGENRAQAAAEAHAAVKDHTTGRPQPKIKLAPSRASDFNNCPLLYRYRTIDRFPEPRTSAPARGDLVHTALERMFDKPAGQRTEADVVASLPGIWNEMRTKNPQLDELTAEHGEQAWLDEAGALVSTYFALEDPDRVPVSQREHALEYRLSDEVLLRGYVDRLDEHPKTGEVRIVDYKTGKSPKLGYEGKALFQLRFYALSVWRTTGKLPSRLQLMYLGDGNVLRYDPTEADLVETENEIKGMWDRIDACRTSGNFPPRKNPLCSSCNFRDRCPEFGGTVPPLPPL